MSDSLFYYLDSQLLQLGWWWWCLKITMSFYLYGHVFALVGSVFLVGFIPVKGFMLEEEGCPTKSGWMDGVHLKLS